VAACWRADVLIYLGWLVEESLPCPPFEAGSPPYGRRWLVMRRRRRRIRSAPVHRSRVWGLDHFVRGREHIRGAHQPAAANTNLFLTLPSGSFSVEYWDLTPFFFFFFFVF